MEENDLLVQREDASMMVEYGSGQARWLDQEWRNYIFNFMHDPERKQQVQQDNKYSKPVPIMYFFQQGSPC